MSNLYKLKINYVSYQGRMIAVPAELSGRTVYDYADVVLKERPDVTKLMWNDRLVRIWMDTDDEHTFANADLF